MRYGILLTSVLFLLPSDVWADVPRTTEPITSALRKAADQGKSVLVEIETDWCEACREFSKTLLSDTEIQTALNDIVYLRYDADEPVGQEAAQRLGVVVHPTFIAVDQRGIERFCRQYSDVSTKEKLLKLILETRASSEAADLGKKRLVAAGGDAKAQLDVADWYLARGQNEEGLKVLKQVAVSKTKQSTPEVRQQALDMYDRLRLKRDWKKAVAVSAVKRVKLTTVDVAIDDLITATVGSPISDKEKAAVFAQLAKRKISEAFRVSAVYVAIAAGFPDEALLLAAGLDPLNVGAHAVALAEIYSAKRDPTAALAELDKAADNRVSNSELSEARARISSGLDEAPEITRIKMQASDQWRRIEETDQLRKIPPPDRNTMSVVHALRKLGAQIGAKCVAHAGNSDRSYVRVTVDNVTGAVQPLEYYTSGMDSELRECIAKQFLAAKMPITKTPIAPQYVVVLYRSVP